MAGERKTSKRTKGVVLEDIDSKLDQLVESHQGLQKQVSVHDKDLQEFQQEVAFKFNVIIKGQQGLQEQIDGLDRKMGELHQEMDYKFEIVLKKLDEKLDRREFETFLNTRTA